MDAIRRVYRPMLARLLAEVFPTYQQTHEQLARSSEDFDKILWQPSPHTRIPEGPLKSALHRWAKEFHAEQDWFLDEILRTLRGWSVAPDWRESLRTNPIVTAPIVPKVGDLAMGERFSFENEPWDPQWRPSDDYKREARKKFEKELSEYITAGKQRAESHGLKRAPHKYSIPNIEWFVLYQFAGFSSTRIANESAKKNTKLLYESLILKGIRTAAKLIGWNNLRPSHPNPPPEN